MPGGSRMLRNTLLIIMVFGGWGLNDPSIGQTVDASYGLASNADFLYRYQFQNLTDRNFKYNNPLGLNTAAIDKMAQLSYHDSQRRMQNLSRQLEMQLHKLQRQTRFAESRSRWNEQQLRYQGLQRRQADRTIGTMERHLDRYLRSAGSSILEVTRIEISPPERIVQSPRKSIFAAATSYPQMVKDVKPYLKAFWEGSKYGFDLQEQHKVFHKGIQLPGNWVAGANLGVAIFEWSGPLVSDTDNLSQGRLNLANSKTIPELIKSAVDLGIKRSSYMPKYLRQPGWGKTAKGLYAYGMKKELIPTPDAAADILDGIAQVSSSAAWGPTVGYLAVAGTDLMRRLTYPLFEEHAMSRMRREMIDRYVQVRKMGYTGSIQDFHTTEGLAEAGFYPYRAAVYGLDARRIEQELRPDVADYKRQTRLHMTYHVSTDHNGTRISNLSGKYSTMTQTYWYRKSTERTFSVPELGNDDPSGGAPALLQNPRSGPDLGGAVKTNLNPHSDASGGSSPGGVDIAVEPVLDRAKLDQLKSKANRSMSAKDSLYWNFDEDDSKKN